MAPPCGSALVVDIGLGLRLGIAREIEIVLGVVGVLVGRRVALRQGPEAERGDGRPLVEQARGPQLLDARQRIPDRCQVVSPLERRPRAGRRPSSLSARG